jgi:hypothetical protein
VEEVDVAEGIAVNGDDVGVDCLRSAETIGSRGPLTRRYRVRRQYLAAWNDLIRQYQPAKSLDDVQGGGDDQPDA